MIIFNALYPPALARSAGCVQVDSLRTFDDQRLLALIISTAGPFLDDGECALTTKSRLIAYRWLHRERRHQNSRYISITAGCLWLPRSHQFMHFSLLPYCSDFESLPIRITKSTQELSHA